MDHHYPWDSQMIEIKSRSGWQIRVYEPLIRHRWSLYNSNPTQALQKLQMLAPTTILPILEHLYANTPVARTNLPAFKTCKIVETIPFESTYHRDMLNFLNDENSSDFHLLPFNSDDHICVHRFMLYARSQFFRSKFIENPLFFQYSDQNMSKVALQMFTAYLYTGKLEALDAVALVELIGAGLIYQLRDPEEIDFLAKTNLPKLLSPQNAYHVKRRAEERNLQDIVELVMTECPC